MAAINSILKYEYALKDHLGNTRLMFSDKNNDGLIQQSTAQETSEVTQENHYTPFGFSMEGTWSNTPSVTDSKYLYNGKEMNDDFGLGLMDYGARMYDAAIGRWNGVDAMAEAYHSLTPYNYTMNNPMRFIDPNGMYSQNSMTSSPNTGVATPEGITGGASIESSLQATVHVIATKTADKTIVKNAVKELNKYIKGAGINAIAVLEPANFDPQTIYKNPLDAVAVVGGTKSEAADYIKENLQSITSEDYRTSELTDYVNCSVSSNPETTDASAGGWSYVIATTTQNQTGFDIPENFSVLKAYHLKSMTEAVALTILHGMGHISGILHGGATKDYGFMDGSAGADYRKKNNKSVIDTIKMTKKDFPDTMKIIYSRFQ